MGFFCVTLAALELSLCVDQVGLELRSACFCLPSTQFQVGAEQCSITGTENTLE